MFGCSECANCKGSCRQVRPLISIRYRHLDTRAYYAGKSIARLRACIAEFLGPDFDIPSGTLVRVGTTAPENPAFQAIPGEATVAYLSIMRLGAPVVHYKIVPEDYVLQNGDALVEFVDSTTVG